MDTKAARETLKALMKWIPNTAARTQIDGLAHLALDELDKANKRNKQHIASAAHWMNLANRRLRACKRMLAGVRLSRKAVDGLASLAEEAYQERDAALEELKRVKEGIRRHTEDMDGLARDVGIWGKQQHADDLIEMYDGLRALLNPDTPEVDHE